MLQTTQAARLAASEIEFSESSPIPVFTISESPFRTFHVASNIQLPIYEPFTQESHKYFRGVLRDMHGIERDSETGNYTITVSSIVDERQLYDLLKNFA